MKWGAVTGAEGYDIYAAFCGREMPDKPTMTVAGTKATLTKAHHKDGNSKVTNDCIKYIIKAYKTVNGAKVYISRSNVNHTVGPKHFKYSDAKRIKTKKSKYTLKVGKKAYLNARATTYNGKKQVSHSATMKYVSSDTSVATVTKIGKIKAVGKGSCKIYIVSACGLTKTVTVKVK